MGARAVSPAPSLCLCRKRAICPFSAPASSSSPTELALSKSSRRSFVGIVFQHMMTASPRRLRIRSSSSAKVSVGAPSLTNVLPQLFARQPAASATAVCTRSNPPSPAGEPPSLSHASIACRVEESRDPSSKTIAKSPNFSVFSGNRLGEYIHMTSPSCRARARFPLSHMGTARPNCELACYVIDFAAILDRERPKILVRLRLRPTSHV